MEYYFVHFDTCEDNESRQFDNALIIMKLFQFSKRSVWYSACAANDVNITYILVFEELALNLQALFPINK